MNTYIARYFEDYIEMFDIDEHYRVVKLKERYYRLLTSLEYDIFVPEPDKKYYIRVRPEHVRIETTDKKNEFYHYIRIIVEEDNKKNWRILRIKSTDPAFFFLIKNLKNKIFNYQLILKSTHDGKSQKLEIYPIFQKEKDVKKEVKEGE